METNIKFPIVCRASFKHLLFSAWLFPFTFVFGLVNHVTNSVGVYVVFLLVFAPISFFVWTFKSVVNEEGINNSAFFLDNRPFQKIQWSDITKITVAGVGL